MTCRVRRVTEVTRRTLDLLPASETAARPLCCARVGRPWHRQGAVSAPVRPLPSGRGRDGQRRRPRTRPAHRERADPGPRWPDLGPARRRRARSTFSFALPLPAGPAVLEDPTALEGPAVPANVGDARLAAPAAAAPARGARAAT